MRIWTSLGLIFLCVELFSQTMLTPDLSYSAHATGLSAPTSFEFISESALLVVEKNSGKVKKINNGLYTGDALDLAVATEGEMGLLGIAKHPDFASNGYIYLFYSRASTDGGPWLDDRLVRYTWNGVSLVSPMDIWILGPTAEYPEPSLYHHGGYLRIGPDDKLYLQRGDMIRWGCFEMNNNPNIVGVSGCIYRLNLDGTAPSDNPFFSNPNPNIQKIWIYGFRNGFGMSWDRSTTNLWFTENGPEVYDEVNIARPAMNSGWRLIMGPDHRDAAYVNNGNQSYNANQLYYLPGAQYHDPVFSYLNPIGISGLEFFKSTRFLATPSVFDNVLIGCTNTYKLYVLPVRSDRMGVSGEGPLADLVADGAAEADVWAIVTNLGMVTDAKIGPDGYMYMCTYIPGRIDRLRPIADAVSPTEVVRVRGVVVTGDLGGSLAYPDNNRLHMRPGPVLTTAQSPIVLELTGVSPFQTSSAIRMDVEASASSASIDMTIELYNYVEQVYVLASHFDLGTSDAKFSAKAPGEPGHFVKPGTNEMRARISLRAGGPVLSFPWSGHIDMVHWTCHAP